MSWPKDWLAQASFQITAPCTTASCPRFVNQPRRAAADVC